ncbi:stress enhanced protein 1, chloroplastic-like [Typha angustifolia]|uniref:stress enhanced protein 1, chloroplastic-like n=1 Tax=Typha angustifolia TaxID=59011 RepID=UPI003C2E6E03
MAQALLSTSSCCSSLLPSSVAGTTKAGSYPRILPFRSTSVLASSFKRGTSHVFWITSNRRKVQSQAISLSIRCEQGTNENNGLDVWLSRLAMVGFVSAITVEIATGKGILENFGLAASLPTLALVGTGLVGVLTAFFIFQSASRD